MSNTSVSRIRLLPKTRGLWSSERLSRRILAKVLGKIEIGSLTIYDGEDTLHFGTPDRAGEPQAQVHVHNAGLYAKVIAGGTIASGEAYMEGDWSSPDLTEVTRLFCANMAAMDSMEARQSWLMKAALKIAHSMNKNTRDGSRKNISAHYDLGNDFFRLFLDPTMM